jgi:signal recognition particle receptor subunit beta
MAVINHAKREINAKIVYYGREGSGKRAALQYIYDRVKPSLRGKLQTLPSGGDSLTFFDFSPFESPHLSGYHIRFHLYSLTGKVCNPAAWKMTLKGADGVMIVADASPDTIPATREVISQLRDFLAAYGVGLHDIPCVLQLNRNGSYARTSAGDMAAALDLPGLPACLSDISGGDGVLKALSLLSREIINRIGKESALRPPENESGSRGDRFPDAGGAVTPETRDPAGWSPPPDPARILGGKTEPQPAGHELSGSEVLQVSLAGEGAACVDGVIRLPLEVSVGGAMRRLVISIGVDRE